MGGGGHISLKDIFKTKQKLTLILIDSSLEQEYVPSGIFVNKMQCYKSK